jgi:hypothetical protein
VRSRHPIFADGVTCRKSTVDSVLGSPHMGRLRHSPGVPCLDLF